MKFRQLSTVGVLALILLSACNTSPKSSESSLKAEKEQPKVIEQETPQQDADKEKYLKTIEFIKSKINGDYEYFNISIEVKNQTLTVIRNNYHAKSSDSKYVVKLKYLNPNQIHFSREVNWPHYNFKIFTTEKKKLVRAINTTKAGEIENYDIFAVFMNCPDKDSAERLSKAFKWLIEYCGGEDEMY